MFILDCAVFSTRSTFCTPANIPKAPPSFLLCCSWGSVRRAFTSRWQSMIPNSPCCSRLVRGCSLWLSSLSRLLPVDISNPTVFRLSRPVQTREDRDYVLTGIRLTIALKRCCSMRLVKTAATEYSNEKTIPEASLHKSGIELAKERVYRGRRVYAY